MRLLAKLFILAILIPLEIWLYALTISILWGWFIVPVFALAALTMPQAYGIGVLMMFLTHRVSQDKDTKEENVYEVFGASISKSLICLLMGWICVTFFM